MLMNLKYLPETQDYTSLINPIKPFVKRTVDLYTLSAKDLRNILDWEDLPQIFRARAFSKEISYNEICEIHQLKDMLFSAEQMFILVSKRNNIYLYSPVQVSKKTPFLIVKQTVFKKEKYFQQELIYEKLN